MVEGSLQAIRVVCSFSIRSPDIQLDLSTGPHGHQSFTKLLGLNASQINVVKRTAFSTRHHIRVETATSLVLSWLA